MTLKSYSSQQPTVSVFSEQRSGNRRESLVTPQLRRASRHSVPAATETISPTHFEVSVRVSSYRRSGDNSEDMPTLLALQIAPVAESLILQGEERINAAVDDEDEEDEDDEDDEDLDDEDDDLEDDEEVDLDEDEDDDEDEDEEFDDEDELDDDDEDLDDEDEDQ